MRDNNIQKKIASYFLVLVWFVEELSALQHSKENSKASLVLKLRCLSLYPIQHSKENSKYYVCNKPTELAN